MSSKTLEREEKNIDVEMVFKYDNFKRVSIAILMFFFVLLGSLIMNFGNLFSFFVGLIVVLFSFGSLVDILFFKSLIFKNNCVIKEWYLFGSKKIKFENLVVGVNKRLWTGRIYFEDKRKRFLSRLIMQFEMFPIGNTGFIKIRNLLIDKKIIKGDENGWNY